MWSFSIFGIPVTVQPYFWLTMVLLSGRAGDFGREELIGALLFVLAGFISIMVHELGHALTARKFGARVEIVLHAFGGYAAYSGVRMSRPQTFAITAAGPGLQLVLGGLVYFSAPYYIGQMNGYGQEFVDSLIWVSTRWPLINLLPVLPLDGGRLVETSLGPKRIRMTLWVSVVSAVVVGVYMLTAGYFFFGIFLGVFAWQSYQALQQTRWR